MSGMFLAFDINEMKKPKQPKKKKPKLPPRGDGYEISEDSLEDMESEFNESE